MWAREHTESTTATPDQLWLRYAQPATWPDWDREVAEVTTQGPVAVGTRGRLKPVRGPAVSFSFTEVTAGVSFTNVSRLPLARLALAHHIEATSAGSRFTHRITITGPLAPLFARVIGKATAATLPTTMRALARLAEADPAPPTPTRS